METLDLPGFLRVLSHRDRGRPMTLITETEPEMRTGGRGDGAGNYPNGFHGKIVRLARRNVWSGTAYQRHVNLQREREGKPTTPEGDLILFESKELWGGQCEYVNRFIRRHRTSRKLYLACKPPTIDGQPAVISHRYQWKANGHEIPPKLLEPWLRKPRQSKSQGTDKPIYWRTIELPHITRITVDGVCYAVEIPSSTAALQAA